MNGNAVGTIIVLIIVVVGGWFLLSKNPTDAPSTIITDQAPITATETADIPPPSPTIIVYNDEGFSPSSVTIPLGTTVTFVNQSTNDMWVASAMHPTHIIYSGTSLSQHCPDTDNSTFDECQGDAPGSSFSFTFTKEGTWNYHDHLTTPRFGTVIVTGAATAATPI